MIRSFRDPRTEALFNDEDVPRFRNIERVARRKLLYLQHAQRLEDLKVPPGMMLNTAQNIDQESAPTFAALQLTKPSNRRATHNLGWNDEKAEVVIGPLAGVSSRQVVVAETPDEFGRLLERFDDFAGSDVVVVYRSDKAFSSAKAPPPRNDGQWLTLKSLAGAGSLTLDSGLIEGGSVRLEAGRAVTLVASSALKLWLLVGRF